MATRTLSRTGGLQDNGIFICYAWPRGHSVTQADCSIAALLFVLHGHKGPNPHRLITAQWHFYLLCMATRALSHTGGLQHNGTFICYAWPQMPLAIQADYSITALLIFMHGHKGHQPHRLITA